MHLLQDSTLLLTPLKNNEFQVTTTNHFSYLPYQQHLLNFNNNNNNSSNTPASGGGGGPKTPFARTSKLRQNFGKKSGNRPKSVDFEVLKSVENICRAQPIVYGPSLVELGSGGGGPAAGLEQGPLRASQRDRLKERVGEWQSVHATRV